MTRDPKQLLGGFATDSLDEAERRELLRAALDDQPLFDALVEEEGLRELLEDPAARQELLAALEEPTAWGRVRAWFEREATLLDLSAVAAIVVAALAGYALLSFPPPALRTASPAARPVGAPLSPQQVAALLAAPAREAVPAGIEIADRPDAAFAPGESVHLRVSLRAPARVALLHEPAGGPGVQLWPGLGQPPALVARPGSGGPAIQALVVDAAVVAGTHRLRLVVAPADLDPGALPPASLTAALEKLSLVDVRYRVTRPRQVSTP
jgi:hypothetical protein